eukprot:34412_1
MTQPSTQCKHAACQCKEYVVNPSKWNKWPWKCKTCFHPAKAHGIGELEIEKLQKQNNEQQEQKTPNKNDQLQKEDLMPSSWEQRYKELQIENQKLKERNKQLESKNAHPIQVTENRHSEEFWNEIYDKINRNPDYVKHLVKKKILTMKDTNRDGWNLLMIAAKYGSESVAQFCLNYGVDINLQESSTENKRDALQIAREYTNYHVEQLLLFSKMNGDAGDEVKETADFINKQDGINENIINELTLIGDQSKQLFEKLLMEVMINLITKKLSISEDLLNLCWHIACRNNKDPLKSELWKALSSTCSDVIERGSKRDWYWLKEFIVKSRIWFRSVSVNSDEETDEKSEENKRKSRYLYYELLDLVSKEANAQLKQLEDDLNVLANENINDWNKLTKWDNIESEHETVEKVRQDTIPNGIVSRFTYNQLSETSGATFNSPKFYDYNQYLSQLVLLGQIVDDEFHDSLVKMFNIDRVTHEGIIRTDMYGKEETKMDSNSGDNKVKYQRGPVKLLERARSKAQNDYSDQAYPASACVLDFNRCALIFNDISTLLKSLQLFVNKVKYYQSGNIIGIVRDKNLFIEYVKNVQYADIKLNVLIKGTHNNIIGEVQFLLQTMKEFKNKAHNLYSI